MTSGMNLMVDTTDFGIVRPKIGTESACQYVSHYVSFSNDPISQLSLTP